MKHDSDCATHNAPALPPGPCDCSKEPTKSDLHEALMALYEAEEAFRAAKAKVDAAEKHHDEICSKVYPPNPTDKAPANPWVEITYTNYRSVTAIRRIEPRSIRFGTSSWHPEPQWLLSALDLERNVEREFAINCILRWRPLTGEKKL